MSALVVGYHPSGASLHALGAARELGRQLDGDIHVAHVVDLSDYPIDPDRHDWESKGEEQLKAEEETVTAAMAVYPGRWEYHLLRGHPGQRLCQLAERTNADMIILGTRGLGLAHPEHLISPSVVKHVINRANRPVLLVPHNEQPH